MPDDHGACQSLRDLLTQEGCDVLVAIGGREALAKLDTEPVDLVLSDETLAALDAASAFDAGHPYSMLEWEMPMALGYGGMFDHIDIPRFPGRR